MDTSPKPDVDEYQDDLSYQWEPGGDGPAGSEHDHTPTVRLPVPDFESPAADDGFDPREKEQSAKPGMNRRD